MEREIIGSRTFTISSTHYKQGRKYKTSLELHEGDTFIASEVIPINGDGGALNQIVNSIYKLMYGDKSNKCSKCSYKIGDYTGDPGYLLYLIFKFRLRLKFLKFKLRLLEIAEVFGFKKSKSTKS